MAVIRNIVVKIGADISSLKSSLKEASESLQDAGDKLKNIGSGLTTCLTLPIAAAAAGLLKLGMDFDEAFDTIRTGTGLTGEALEGLKDDFKAVYASVPADLESVGNAVSALATRTGLTGKALQGLASQLLTLTSITGEELNGAIQNSTRLLGDWSVAVQDIGNTMDYLFRVSQSTGISFTELAGILVHFGAPLRQMGFDLETAAALVGKFEQAGVNTELVLGGLRIALGKMAKEGITDTAAALREVIARIKEAGSTGEANAVALELFGARIGPDMAAAIREGRFELDGLVASLKNSKETISSALSDTMDFPEQLKLMKNKIAVALEPLGSSLMQVLNGAMPAISAVAEKLVVLVNWFTSLAGSVQGAIAGVLAFLAALGPGIYLIGAFISAMGVVAGALASLTLPTSAAIAALAALAAGFAIAYAKSGDFRQGLARVWDSVSRAFQAALTWMQGIWTQYGPGLLQGIQTAWEKLLVFMQPLLQALKESFAKFMQSLPGIWAQAQDLFAAAIPLFKLLGEDLKPLVELIGVALAGAFAFFLSALNGTLAALGPFLEALLSLQTTVISVIGMIAALLRGEWSTAWECAKNAVAGAWSFIRSLFEANWNYLRGFFSMLLSVLNAFGIDVDGSVRGFLLQVKNSLTGGLAGIPEQVKAVFVQAIQRITALGGAAWKAAQNLAGKMWSGFKQGLGIHSPSYIEEAIFSIQDAAREMTGALQGDFNLLARLPGKSEWQATAASGALPPSSLLENGMQEARAGVQVNVTGNYIKDDYDIDAIGNKLVRKLRLAGMF